MAITAQPVADFGAQGGDPSRGVDMDLSTCVNRYGPAPAAVAALREIEPGDILMHPYDAADRLIALYRWATEVTDGSMIAGRGVSEFLWAMGREVPPSDVAVPLPGYTDYLRVFPGRGFAIDDTSMPSTEQVDAALGAARVVLLSNPNNPTGVHLDPRGLVAAAAAHPDSVLVVDESYINFTPDPTRWSVLGSREPNVVVLRSTSKFYGIAALRAGIAWSQDPRHLRDLIGQQENWGLSGIDVTAACAAVRRFDWSKDSRALMHADNAWLAEQLTGVPGLDVRVNANVHWQFAFTPRAAEVAGVYQQHGIGVRVLGAAHGVRPDALRIVAPRADERDRFAAATAAVAASLSGSGAR